MQRITDIDEQLLIDEDDEDDARDINEIDIDELTDDEFWERFGAGREDVIGWDYDGNPIFEKRYGGMSYYDCNTDWRDW